MYEYIYSIIGPYVKPTLTFIIIYSVIYTIIIIASLWKILIKEEEKPWLSLIPIYNFYLLFEICRIPFWTIFIPLVNLVVMFLMPYKLSKQYRANKIIQYASVFIPFVVLPYIAYSDLQNKDRRYSQKYFKTVNDINILETKLTSDTDTIIDDYIEQPKKNIKQESNLNDFVEKIESTIINDEYVYEEPVIEKQEEITEIKNETLDNEEVEIFKEISNDEIKTIKDVEALESNLLDEAKQEKKVYESTEVFKQVGPSTEAIAFGGKEQEENSTKAKVEELKCPRCGSSLVGANGFCPGCGNQI